MDKPNSRYKYGRRRSRSLGGILNAREVCKTIRKSLSSSQKLQLLLQYAFEHSLSMAEKDLCEDVDDIAFRKSVCSCQVNFESKIEELNYCSLAVADDKLNDVNASLGEKYKQYKSAVAKLEDECNQWDKLVARQRSYLAEEVEMTDIHFEGEFNAEKYQHLDYFKILEDTELRDTHLDDQIINFKNKSKFLRKCAQVTNKGISSWNKDAGKTFLKKFEDTPRKLIKKCF